MAHFKLVFDPNLWYESVMASPQCRAGKEEHGNPLPSKVRIYMSQSCTAQTDSDLASALRVGKHIENADDIS